MFYSYNLRAVNAFGYKETAFINIGIPVVKAYLKARRKHYSVCKAMLQAAFGGLLMQEAFKMAAGSEYKPAWQAWQAKFMVNLGASLAESVTDKFVYRMDFGPVWLITDGKQVKFKPAVASALAVATNLADGSKLDWGRSFKYGTLAFKRPVNDNGTLSRSGALAYTNANIFTTDDEGSHAGHELVHTFQYRREAFLMPNISKLFPEIGDKIGKGWIDDTGWSISWGLQCGWADMMGKSKDFDIPMEKEAYYLEGKYRTNH